MYIQTQGTDLKGTHLRTGCWWENDDLKDAAEEYKQELRNTSIYKLDLRSNSGGREGRDMGLMHMSREMHTP